MPIEILDRIQNYLDHPLQKINEIDTITHDVFYKTHIKTNTPIVMTKMMDDWNATKKWSLDYFKKIGEDKQTYISKGNIRQQETHWEHGSFLDYLEEVKHSETSKSETYISNISILKMFPELKEDVDFSLISNYKIRNSTSLWIGPPGTITGWHTDRLSDNILAQVKGRKLVFLVNPNQSKFMHTSDKYEPGSRLSAVDMEKFDENKFPKFKKNAQVFYTILEPGKMLFIPKLWWHCVYGIDISISTNNFGYTPYDNFKMKSQEFSKRMLHSAGLYGKNCVCHYYDENGKRHKR